MSKIFLINGRTMKRLIVAAVLFVTAACWLAGASAQEQVKQKVIFDFANPDDAKAWTNLVVSAVKGKEPAKEPAVKIEVAKGLKLTFAGGNFPTVTTTRVSDDWLKYQLFTAQVTASRPCLVGFTITQEKSQRGGGWDATISRWTKTAFLEPGVNKIEAPLPQPNNYALHPKWGKITGLDIFMYNPKDGESITINEIRLSPDKLPPPQVRTFTVAGADWKLSGKSSADAVIELGKKLKAGWKAPEPKSLAQIESEFKARHAELKKKHPNAILAILRDGEKGYDPKQPDKVYAGWKDAYFNSHGPDGEFVTRSENRGKSATHEIFMRHRSPLMRVDLASIPPGADILAAQLIIIRNNDKVLGEHNPQAKPTMWVVEPCNRAWEEYEVNAFEYARDKFWKAVGGMHWDADADFEPTFLAHGPGIGKVNVWDFTEAVRYWTSGKHANHGFMLHGDSHDYMIGSSREAKEVRDRPAVLVIYNAK
jgi:hypothetical protein